MKITNEEAIQTLKDIYPSQKQIVTGEYPHVAESIDLAIEALEKQIPKKPNDISTYEGWVVKSEEGYFFGTCPFCKSHVIIEQKTCDCGQKLDWEELK